MKYLILNIIALMFFTIGLSKAAHAGGACVYTLQSPHVYHCRDVANIARCRNVGTTNEYFPNKSCADLRKENNSYASVNIRNLPEILDQVLRNGYATGLATISAVDTFANSSNLAGTQLLLKGEAKFALKQSEAGMIQVKSLSTVLKPIELRKGEMPMHLYRNADALFERLIIQNFTFSGSLKTVRGGYQLQLKQHKVLNLAGTEMYGDVQSKANAFIAKGSSQFRLLGHGVTFHPALEEKQSVREIDLDFGREGLIDIIRKPNTIFEVLE